MPASHQAEQRPRPWRQRGRWLALFAGVALVWLGGTLRWTSILVPAFSPFIALSSGLSCRAVSGVTLLALPVLILALGVPRGFCRYVCPTGLLQELAERLRPAAPRPKGLPAIGSGLVWMTLGGACLGYPLFLWLDPLAIFSAAVNGWRAPLTLAAVMAGMGLPLLLVCAVGWPRAWCHHVCPLGATQELLTVAGQGIRRRLFSHVEEPAVARFAADSRLGRRSFLGLCAGAGLVVLGRAVAGASLPPRRPPGAIEEARFAGVCLRCGNCVRACPPRIIRPDWGHHGIAGLLTPVLCFDNDYCREDCHRCNEVCPSGAIARLSLPEKRRRLIGRARIDLSLCLLAEGRECTACIRGCPYGALAMDANAGGFSTFPRLDAAKCNGCGACEMACPTRPRRAVQVWVDSAGKPGALHTLRGDREALAKSRQRMECVQLAAAF